MAERVNHATAFVGYGLIAGVVAIAIQIAWGRLGWPRDPGHYVGLGLGLLLITPLVVRSKHCERPISAGRWVAFIVTTIAFSILLKWIGTALPPR